MNLTLNLEFVEFAVAPFGPSTSSLQTVAYHRAGLTGAKYSKPFTYKCCITFYRSPTLVFFIKGSLTDRYVPDQYIHDVDKISFPLPNGTTSIVPSLDLTASGTVSRFLSSRILGPFDSTSCWML